MDMDNSMRGDVMRSEASEGGQISGGLDAECSLTLYYW